MKLTKRISGFLILFVLGSMLVVPSMSADNSYMAEQIKTYKDIPFITEDEISAIENLKRTRDKLVFGTLLGTEYFVLPDGTAAGFIANFCELFEELFGIDVEIKLYEWDGLLEALDSGEIDFTSELTATEERQKIYAMSQPVAERLFRIFTHVNSAPVQTEADIRGLKIGFLEGSITADTIKSSYDIPFTVVDIDNYATAAKMIASGEIDGFIEEAVADPAFEQYSFIRSEVVFTKLHEPVSLTTSKDEIYAIISVLDKYINAGGFDKLYELYKQGDFEYSKHKLNNSFTEEEKDFLAKRRNSRTSILVAYESDNYPINFYNESEGEFQGIAIDILKEISNLIGVNFKSATENGASWSQILEMAQAGDVRMVAQLLHTDKKSDDFIWAPVPYSFSNYALLSKIDYPHLENYQVTRVKVGVVNKTAYEDIYNQIFPHNDNLIKYDTMNDCLDALERGDIELLMASENTLFQQTNYREKSGFKINIRLGERMESQFGFGAEDEILCSIISKAQQFVETDIIAVSWTGRTFDYAKKIADQRNRFMTIFVGVLTCALGLMGLLLVKNIKLTRKMANIANHDPLTGALSRRAFMDQCRMNVERSFRLGSNCFILMFDLDHFKKVNDNYGHLAGDKVLHEVSLRVKKSIRTYDLFGRYGGEEFIIYMSDMDKKNILLAAERIREDICTVPVDFESIKISISASIGIAQASPTNRMDMAIKYSDAALYQAKDAGRNKVIFYEEESS